MNTVRRLKNEENRKFVEKYPHMRYAKTISRIENAVPASTVMRGPTVRKASFAACSEASVSDAAEASFSPGSVILTKFAGDASYYDLNLDFYVEDPQVGMIYVEIKLDGNVICKAYRTCPSKGYYSLEKSGTINAGNVEVVVGMDSDIIVLPDSRAPSRVTANLSLCPSAPNR